MTVEGFMNHSLAAEWCMPFNRDYVVCGPARMGWHTIGPYAHHTQHSYGACESWATHMGRIHYVVGWGKFGHLSTSFGVMCSMPTRMGRLRWGLV